MPWAALLLANALLAQMPATAAPQGNASTLTLPQVGPPRATDGTGENGSPMGGYGAPAGTTSEAAPKPPSPGGNWLPDYSGGGMSSGGAAASAAPSAAAAPTEPSPGAAQPQTPSGGGFGGISNIYKALETRERLREERAASQMAPKQASPGGIDQGAGSGGLPSRPAQQQLPLQTSGVPRLSPESMLEEVMTLPAGTTVAGRSVTLLEVLGQVRDRGRRLAITHAYWRLVAALGEYRCCWDEARQIQSIGSEAIESGLLASAQQAADRELTAAELEVLNSQYALAEAAGLDASGQLPLPGDRPHLGTYYTHFDEIYADQTAPGQTRLLHRTLPLEHKLIGVRGEAVQAAENAFQAVNQAYYNRLADGADVLAALREITTQRRAWIDAVAAYNHSIAEYALTIAGPEISGRGLVGLLIKVASAPMPVGNESPTPGVPTLAPREPVADAMPTPALPPSPRLPAEISDSAVTPATADTPLAENFERTQDWTVLSAVGEEPVEDARADAAPSEDPPGRETQKPGQASPVPAVSNANETPEAPSSPSEAANAKPEQAVAADGTDSQQPDAAVKPSESQTAESAETAGSVPDSRDLVVQTSPLVAVDEEETSAVRQTVNRQVGPAPSGSQVRLYGNLVGLGPGVQAKRLVADWLGQAGEKLRDAESVDLESCLQRIPAAQRHAVIEAFWEASHGVAELEICRRHAQLLDGLVNSVTLGQAGTSDAMAQLRLVQLEAEARILEAETRLLATRYELTKRCGRPLTDNWLVPTTLPLTGNYHLGFDTPPRQFARSWPLKRLATVIPALGRSLKDRAVAVVEADARRVEAVGAYQAGSIRFDRVLAAVDQQTEECLELLRLVSAYNQSTAEYATLVVPDSLPVKDFVGTLVLR